jgi:hypothetical protein
MMQAGFNGTCACGAQIVEGDDIGKVDGEWVCVDCIESMGEDEWPPRPEEADDA